MSLVVKTFYGNRTGLANDIVSSLSELGITSAVSSTADVAITDWNNISSVTFTASANTSSAISFTYAINDEVDNEFIFIVLTTQQTTNTNITGFFHAKDGSVNALASTSYLCNMFDFSNGTMGYSDDLEISKILVAKGTSAILTDITNLNIYKPNGLLTQNVIYKDEANDEYIGINQYMAVKKG